MKHILFLASTCALLLLSPLTFAKKAHVQVIYGNLDALKGVKKLNVQYDYSKMSVGAFSSDKDYIANNKEKLNDKEPGRGDKWAREWVADRQALYEPGFENEFNSNCDIQIGKFKDKKYTMIFKTLFTEQGFNVGVSSEPAYIDGEAWIVETANQNNVICKIEFSTRSGRNSNDYDTGERIEKAYSRAGIALGRFFQDAGAGNK